MMDNAVSADEAGHVSLNKWRLARRFAVQLFCCALILAFDASDGDNFNGDIDDLLRSLQIRELFYSGRWHDLGLPGLVGPEIYLSAWSRLVDLPYWLIASGLAPLTGEQPGLEWSYRLWPPVLLMGSLLLYAWIQDRMAPSLSPLTGVLSIMLGAIAFLEFAPGRIDHHNVQMLLLMAVLFGLTRQSLMGGAIAGVAGVLSVATGLETIPLLAAAYSLAVTLWLLQMDGARETLLGLALANVLATPVATMLLIGPEAFIIFQSDMLSAPYIYALMGFGIVAAICCWAGATGMSILLRLMAIGMPVVLLAALVLLFPAILLGPFQMIDPDLKTVWLDRIPQEMSIIAIFQRFNLLLIGIFSLFLVVLALMVARVADDLNNARKIPWAVVVMAVASILCALFAVRFLRFAALFVSLVLPYAILWLQERMSQRRLFAPATFAIALLPFIAVLMMISWISPTKRPTDTAFHILNDGCETADFSILHTLAPGRILAGPTLGIHIAYEVPGRFTVSNVPFQRAATGIRRTLDAFMTPVAEIQPLRTLGYDYVAICAPKSAISPADGSFYQALAMSVQVAGLEPLNDGQFRIYRIAR